MSADHFHAVGPGEGEAIWFLQTLMSVKASGAESGGAFSLIEVHYPPAFSPPRHIHHHEDESFYVLDGEVTFICGDRTWRTQQGAFVVLPRGIEHGFTISPEAPSADAADVVGPRVGTVLPRRRSAGRIVESSSAWRSRRDTADGSGRALRP